MPCCPPKPCLASGCRTLVSGGTYCPDHAHQVARSGRDYDARRKDAITVRIRSSGRWQKLRRAKQADNPLCEDPFHIHARAAATVPGTEIHHIIPIITRPDLAFSRANLMCLCSRCHNRIERTIP